MPGTNLQMSDTLQEPQKEKKCRTKKIYIEQENPGLLMIPTSYFQIIHYTVPIMTTRGCQCNTLIQYLCADELNHARLSR